MAIEITLIDRDFDAYITILTTKASSEFPEWTDWIYIFRIISSSRRPE